LTQFLKKINMIKIALRRIMKKWKLSQASLGSITNANRGIVQSYLKEKNSSKPSVDFMIRLEKLCGGKLTVRQIWENDFDEEDIPIQPILDETTLDKAKDTSDLKIEEAFKTIMKEVVRLRNELDDLRNK